MMTEGAYLFHAPTSYDEQTVSKKWKEDAPALMSEWIAQLTVIDDFTSEKIETSFKSFLELKGLGIGAVLPLFRLLITGAGMGPSMFEIASFLGKEECITRMNNGLSRLK
jgi:glutamyl-tRNA synthetase